MKNYPDTTGLKEQKRRLSYRAKKSEGLDSIKRYLNDIEKYKVLTPKQEVDLFVRYESWDENALNEIVNHNLRFVVYLAKSFLKYWVPIDDLIQEWNIWLYEAAKKFDHTRWFKFISYASYFIVNNMIWFINSYEKMWFTRISKIPFAKIRVIIEEFFQENERYPNDEELEDIFEEILGDRFVKYIKYIEYTIKYIQAKTWWELVVPLNHTEWELRDRGINPDGLFEVLQYKPESWDPYIDVVPAENNVEILTNQKDVKRIVTFYVDKLPDYEREVLKMYYWIWGQQPMNLFEIWSKFWFSQERARQIKEKWVDRLKSIMPKEYVELL